MHFSHFFVRDSPTDWTRIERKVVMMPFTQAWAQCLWDCDWLGYYNWSQACSAELIFFNAVLLQWHTEYLANSKILITAHKHVQSLHFCSTVSLWAKIWIRKAWQIINDNLKWFNGHQHYDGFKDSPLLWKSFAIGLRAAKWKVYGGAHWGQ